MPKPKKPIREMHRWEKMMAGATDMEELLVEVHDWIWGDKREDWNARNALQAKIKAQLVRTGRLKPEDREVK
jgi:hypothetical protein